MFNKIYLKRAEKEMPLIMRLRIMQYINTPVIIPLQYHY